MKRLLMVVPAALVLIGSGALAAPTGGAPAGPTLGGSNGGSAADHGNAIRKQHAIFALLQKGKQIQLADGGTLTAGHHAQLQHEFDAILAGNY